MRIVGGEFRGRPLKGPSTQAVRPTSDRLRESLFNILAHNYPDALEGVRVIDLFAGTGALGLEAMSRGARFGLFVDDSTEGRALTRENVEALSLVIALVDGHEIRRRRPLELPVEREFDCGLGRRLQRAARKDGSCCTTSIPSTACWRARASR